MDDSIKWIDDTPVVREFKSGSVTIQICDDCCKNTTEEEVQEKLRRMSEIASRYYAAKATKDETA